VWAETAVLVAGFSVPLAVYIDIVAVRLCPRDRFALGTAFEQQIPGHLLLDRVMSRRIEVFGIFDSNDVYPWHIAPSVFKLIGAPSVQSRWSNEEPALNHMSRYAMDDARLVGGRQAVSALECASRSKCASQHRTSPTCDLLSRAKVHTEWRLCSLIDRNRRHVVCRQRIFNRLLSRFSHLIFGFDNQHISLPSAHNYDAKSERDEICHYAINQGFNSIVTRAKV
jgi:hypothetical protein